jgi:Cys-tRNA(Pro)/Cys-tRNA(Cys) deacylase
MRAVSTPALEVLRRQGIDHRVRSYTLPERHGRAREDRPDYGLEAAAALGVEPGRVCKTLIAVLDDGRLVAAVLPVDRQLDLKALAAAAGARRAALAEPPVAERAAGSVVGGISPLGTRRRLDVVMDGAAMGHPTVLVSAGRRGLQVELAPADLVRATAATIGPIGRLAM